MKTLFIGGTGTLSNAAAREALRHGIDLWLLVRGTRDHRIPPGARVLRGDIRKDPRALAPTLAPHEWDCVVDWVAYEEEDVRRDLEMFRGRTKRYVFISTTSVYKKPLARPIVDENAPIGNPIWSYADKKARCERIVAESRIPHLIVRPGYCYAEFTLPSGFAGMGFGIAKRILEGKPILVHGDGTGWFTFTWNEDFARAFVPLLKRAGDGEVYQIATDECATWLRLYDAIAGAVGREAKYAFASSEHIGRFDRDLGASLLGDKAHSYVLDVTKIRRCVPESGGCLALSDGMRRCLAWSREHPDEVRMSPERDLLMERIVESLHVA